MPRPLVIHSCTSAGAFLLSLALCGVAPCAVVAPQGEEKAPQSQPSTEPSSRPSSQPSSQLTATQPAGEEGGLPIHGSLASRYWLRWAGGSNDQDLYEVLSLDVGDPQLQPVTLHLMGRLAADLDGNHGASSRFFNISDTFDNGVDARLYYAYADVHCVPGLDVLRVGRQELWETPEFLYFDGLHVESEQLGGSKVQIGAYGGASVHLFEASHSGDWLAGTYVQARPWQGGRLRADYMHVADDQLLGRHDNDLLGLGAWQTVAEKLQLDVRYTRLEDHDRDVKVRAAWNDPQAALLLQATWYQLLATERDLVVELDPFFSAVREYFPFRQASILASKGLWDHLDLQAGFDVRRVTDDARVGEFNRDYERYSFTAGTHDLPWEGLSLSASGDVWNSNGQNIFTWGADLSQRFGKDLTASAGTYYSLYKFELFLNQERDHVRTWYGKLRYKSCKALVFDLAYEWEHDDFDEYQWLRLGVTWRF